MNRDYLKYFPDYQPYPNQIVSMDAIQEALIKKQIFLFEGACGTGKTLSALVPSLHIAKQERKKIIVATSNHQQMEQFIAEAREIKKKADVKILVLKGRESTCPNHINPERCSDLIKKTYQLENNGEESFELDIENETNPKNRYCKYFRQILRGNNDDFRSWLFSGVRSSNEIEKWALKKNSCGYELLKRSLKEADVLICDYNYVLNESIRNWILERLNTSLSNIILIFDEAHNIESRARNQSSFTLTEHEINNAIEETVAYKDTQDLETFMRVLLDTIRSAYNLMLDKKFSEREKVGNEWYDLRIDDPKERHDLFKLNLLNALGKAGIKKPDETIEHIKIFGLKIDAIYEKEFKEEKSSVRKICSSLNAAIFLSVFFKLSNNRGYYPILGVKRPDNEIYGQLELLTCIPKNVTAPIFEEVHAAILMSATLTPFETIKSTLGITRETCEKSFGLTFPKEKRLTIAVSIPPLFAKDREDPATKEIIIKVLNNIIEQSDGNVIIFFPSSFEATKYKNRIKTDVPIFLDEVGISASPIRDEFFKLGESEKKAVLISYMQGTLTEGINYENGRGRTVVIVGVGYPALTDRMRAVESAYDGEFGHGWDYAFQIPTIRKVRQALGRVVRSPDDYGARVLLDGRYTSKSAKHFGEDSVLKFFPEEERAEIVDVEPDRVKYSLMNFFENIRKIKNKPLIEEIEKLQMERDSLKKDIEGHEKNNVILNEKLKVLDEEFNKIRPILEAKELKERWDDLVHEKEKLQNINEQVILSIENMGTDNIFDKEIFKAMNEFCKIEQSIKALETYIDDAKLYNANKGVLLKYPNSYPDISINAKKHGVFGKSTFELKNLIQLKENELNSIKKRERELRPRIEKETENNAKYSKFIEKTSINDKRIEDIDSLLNTIDIQKIEKINVSILNSPENNELSSNLNKVRESIGNNKAQLLDYRNKKSSIDKRIGEINILFSSSHLTVSPTSSGV